MINEELTKLAVVAVTPSTQVFGAIALDTPSAALSVDLFVIDDLDQFDDRHLAGGLKSCPLGLYGCLSGVRAKARFEDGWQANSARASRR